jgi:hypothetical protein
VLRLIALAQRHEGAWDAAMNRQSFVDCKRAAGPTRSLQVDNGRITSTAAEAAGVAARHGAPARTGAEAPVRRRGAPSRRSNLRPGRLVEGNEAGLEREDGANSAARAGLRCGLGCWR